MLGRLCFRVRCWETSPKWRARSLSYLPVSAKCFFSLLWERAVCYYGYFYYIGRKCKSLAVCSSACDAGTRRRTPLQGMAFLPIPFILPTTRPFQAAAGQASCLHCNPISGILGSQLSTFCFANIIPLAFFQTTLFTFLPLLIPSPIPQHTLFAIVDLLVVFLFFWNFKWVSKERGQGCPIYQINRGHQVIF